MVALAGGRAQQVGPFAAGSCDVLLNLVNNLFEVRARHLLSPYVPQLPVQANKKLAYKLHY